MRQPPQSHGGSQCPLHPVCSYLKIYMKHRPRPDPLAPESGSGPVIRVPAAPLSSCSPAHTPPVPLKSPRARIGAGPRCAPAAGTDEWVGGVSPGPHPQRTSPPNLHSLTQHSSSMPGLCQVPWCLQHGSDLPLTSKNPWAGGQAGLETPQS